MTTEVSLLVCEELLSCAFSQVKHFVGYMMKVYVDSHGKFHVVLKADT